MSLTRASTRLPRWSLPAVMALGLMAGWAGARIDLSALASDSDEALGKAQVERFFSGLVQGPAALEPVLAESFQLIRSDGTLYDKAAYLAGISRLSGYKLSDVKTTRSGEVMTVTFRSSFEGVVGGIQQTAETLPRMAVFHQQNGAWRMVAYANLGQGAGNVTADAKQALQAFYDATYSQDPAKTRALLASEFQLARSDGSGYVAANYADNLPTFTQAATISDVTATGFGDIMVARYRVTIGLTIDGKQAEAVSPRLTVFRRDMGQWRVVAHANFARLEQ